MKLTKWLGYGEDFFMVAEHCLLIVSLCDMKSPRSFGGVSLIRYLIPLTCFTIMTYPSVERLATESILG